MAFALMCGCSKSKIVFHSTGKPEQYEGKAHQIEVVENEENGIATKLKERPIVVFKAESEVKKAYLVRVLYNGTERGVACAIDGPAQLSESLRNRVTEPFYEIRNNQEDALDMVAVNDKTRPELEQKAKPFYVQGTN